MVVKHLAGSALFVLAAAAGATAADFGSPGPVMPDAQPIAGYVDVHGGGLFGTDTYSDAVPPDETETASGGIVGGAGRGAFTLGPGLTVQGDAWFDSFSLNVGGTDYQSSETGVGGHLAWHVPGGDDTLGVLASLGTNSSWDDGFYSNIGVEAVHNAGNWRLYGQAGWTRGLTGDAAANADSDLYAALEAEYFINPNLFVSASLGADRSTWPGAAQNELSWGARVEFKPDASPVSFYVAYQGWGWSTDYPTRPATDTGVEHEILVGLRVPFGVNTLQDMQTRVGLSDMNAIFGDFTNR
jgi:hypothetical protein